MSDTFQIGANGYPEPIYAPEPPEYAMEAPYPASFWRIASGYNNGYPFNMLMPDVPYLAILPAMSQGYASELTDTSSLPYKRATTSGYTNPDLIRFQDKEFSESTIQKVGIFGVNSYRYMETDDYEDGSTTSEIP